MQTTLGTLALGLLLMLLSEDWCKWRNIHEEYEKVKLQGPPRGERSITVWLEKDQVMELGEPWCG